MRTRPKQWLLAVAIASAACQSSQPNVDRIQVGMTKQELTTLLGAPLEQRPPVAAANGQLEEIWLYDLGADVKTGGDVTVGVLKSGVGFFDDPTAGRRHAFVFVGDKLVRWGQAR